MALIGTADSSRFIEWNNLGVTTLKHATCAPTGKPDNYRFYLPNFFKFSHIYISHKLWRTSQFLEILVWPTLQK